MPFAAVSEWAAVSGKPAGGGADADEDPDNEEDEDEDEKDEEGNEAATV